MGAKWSETTPAEKLLSMYTMFLGNPRALSLGDLAERLGCSKQTVNRLITQMESSQFGKIIREQKGRQSYYRMVTPGNSPRVSLSSQGLARLALCREWMQKLVPPNMMRLMKRSLLQAATYQDGEDNAPLEGMGAQINKGRIDYAPFEAILNRLLAAITGKRVCEVTYRARRGKPGKTFFFAPKRLLAYHECIYVAGWRVTDKGPALSVYDNPFQLALQRFVACELTKRLAAKLPQPPVPESLGIMGGNEFEVTVRFDQHSATYAAERQWSAGQQLEELADGSVIIKIRAGNEAECVSWALGFGDTAEILAPAWLREKMKDKIDAMATLYE